ncbi:hypothetical protein [Algicella marina]|uniref:Uncharacterized protein n=1 Tax=Algicella marina TaxID=2683284 RepID=A0A6P1T1P6_9RHOB|nr:hypothetical protein [Algicella marina]QHQ36658.1 hypothetical protein GO499_16490 [Algicella marina]
MVKDMRLDRLIEARLKDDEIAVLVNKDIAVGLKVTGDHSFRAAGNAAAGIGGREDVSAAGKSAPTGFGRFPISGNVRPAEGYKGLPGIFVEGILRGGGDDPVFEEGAEVALILRKVRTEGVVRRFEAETARLCSGRSACGEQEDQSEQESECKIWIHKFNSGYNFVLLSTM